MTEAEFLRRIAMCIALIVVFSVAIGAIITWAVMK